MAKEKVVTATGIKAEELVKVGGYTALLDKLGTIAPPDFGKKSELPVGRWATTDGKTAVVYTVVEVDLDAEYAALEPKDQRVCWADGFKRKHYNGPTALEVRSELGLIEVSTGRKAVDKYQWEVIIGLARIGMSLAQILSVPGANFTEALVDKAIAQAKEGK